MPLLRVRLEPKHDTSHIPPSLSGGSYTSNMHIDHQEHPVKRTPPHVLIVAITAGAVTVFVVTALILCPPDRINPILEWFRIVTGAVG